MSNQDVPLYNKWLSVDLDGTILEFPSSLESLGDPKPAAQSALVVLRSIGYKICIHTSRPVDQFYDILVHLDKHCIPFDEINADCAPFRCTKPLADLYIDDRAFFFRDWRQDFRHIISRLMEQGLEYEQIEQALNMFYGR